MVLDMQAPTDEKLTTLVLDAAIAAQKSRVIGFTKR